MFSLEGCWTTRRPVRTRARLLSLPPLRKRRGLLKLLLLWWWTIKMAHPVIKATCARGKSPRSMSLSLGPLIPDGRTAVRGSMMTRTEHVSLIAAISLGRCPGRVKGVARSLPVVGLIVRTWERRRIHEGSPPAASTRGLITSGGLSSGAMRMTLPFMPGEPSGMGRPVVKREARSRAKRDLPRPGSPSRMVNLSRMIRPGQSHWSDCVL